MKVGLWLLIDVDGNWTATTEFDDLADQHSENHGTGSLIDSRAVQITLDVPQPKGFPHFKATLAPYPQISINTVEV